METIIKTSVSFVSENSYTGLVYVNLIWEDSGRQKMMYKIFFYFNIFVWSFVLIYIMFSLRIHTESFSADLHFKKVPFEQTNTIKCLLIVCSVLVLLIPQRHLCELHELWNTNKEI